MMVLFDLPVTTSTDRKIAAGFRKTLLEKGFSMAQFSVYYKLLPGKEAVESLVAFLKRIMPRKGKVEIVCITDRQYENILLFQGSDRTTNRKMPDQLQLF